MSKLESQCGQLRETVAERNTMLRNMQDVINFRAKERDIGANNCLFVVLQLIVYA